VCACCHINSLLSFMNSYIINDIAHNLAMLKDVILTKAGPSSSIDERAW